MKSGQWPAAQGHSRKRQCGRSIFRFLLAVPLCRCAAAHFLLLCLAGCMTPWEKSTLLKDDRAEIGSVQGPTERRLLGRRWERRKAGEDSDEDGLLKPIAGIDDYHAAEKLYEDEKYPEAEKAFKTVAKKFKKSEIREDALFMQAEAAFSQEHYADAHDLYAQLLKDYPTTRHLDVISKRMFKVAMIWLDHPEVAEVGEIQQVNHDRYSVKLPPADKSRQPKRNVLVPNFTDETRPLFDPQGNAITALRSIWTNDPTGPLADDALMLAASHYARSGDFVEADRHFTMLREQFPNSPHVQKAFELGAHTKLMSYEGADYDGKSLTDAEQLKLATLRLYPEMENKGRLEKELKKIQLAKADRLWSMAEFYYGKGNKKASAIYCHLLLSEYGNSPYAEKAEEHLARLGPGYADGRALQSSYPDPPKTLITSIFPPDDNGGIPVPPPDPSLPSPPKLGAKLALFKPERVQQRAPSSAPESQEKLGAKLAIVKPPKANATASSSSGKSKVNPKPPAHLPSNDEDEESELETASDSDEESPRRKGRPKPLPERIDSEAKPAPFGRPIPNDGEEAHDVDETEDEDSAAGHTRLQ